ncbi:MAG: hypothetical protein ABID38_02975 [Candidatus Diapherotrites archaeon]
MALRFPCEIIGWHVLPAIRKELATYLVNEKKLSRKEVSKKLGLTEAAICQYLKDKRGAGFKFSKKEQEKIHSIGDSLIEAKHDEGLVFLKDSCDFCMDLRKEKSLCDIHRSESNGLKNCQVCFQE